MTEGFGINTVPIMLAPSGSGTNLMLKEVTLKPARPFNPINSVQWERAEEKRCGFWADVPRMLIVL